MKARLKYLPLWLRIALGIYAVVLGWLVVARVSGGEQQIVLEEPLELSGRPTLGREDAPVSIVIFSDFQCVYCRDFDREVLPRLERKFVETGKAKITLLHYPFMSENSHRAALAAECVYRQNPQAFWTYKSAVFELQKPFGEWATPKSLLRAARETNLGIDVTDLKRCLEVGRSKVQLEADRALAESLEVDYVPTIIVKETNVAPTFSALAKAINGSKILRQHSSPRFSFRK